ncbi:MAG: hypothetical protein AB2693_34190 [Candidatus Thiodiazotropha sp.]
MTLRELIEETKKWLSDGWDHISGTFSNMGNSLLDAEVSTVFGNLFTILAWLVGGAIVLFACLVMLGVLGKLTGRFLKRYYPPLYNFFKYYDPPDDYIGLVILLAIQGVVVYAANNSGVITGSIVIALICLVMDLFIVRGIHKKYKRLKAEQNSHIALID